MGRRILPHPAHPPHPEEVKEQLSKRICKQLVRRIPPHPTHPNHPEKVNKKLVLLHVISEIGIKRRRKRTISL